jgi:adenine-specific DNA-methyltransferase
LTNIRQGNSLVSGTSEELESAFGPNWRDKHPFNWEEQFANIMERGGFDVIVGNPPYGAKLDRQERSYFNARFQHQDYQLDSYLLFLERAISLLAPNGYLGLILPNTWLVSLTYVNIRRLLTQQTTILGIGYISTQVFPDAIVDTVILLVQKRAPSEGPVVEVVQRGEDDWEKIHSVPQQRWAMLDGQPINVFLDEAVIALLQRVHQSSTPLGEICIITQGCKPYQTGKGDPPQTREIVDSKPFDSESKLDDTFRPLLRGSYMNRYVILWKHNYWISYGKWLAEPRPSAGFDLPEKIIIRQTGDSPIATLDRQQFIVRDNLYTIRPRHDGLDLRYVLGLLNSRLMTFVYQSINPEQGEALAQVKKGHLVQLPIRRINFDDPQDVARHDRMVEMVEEMLRLQKEHAQAEALKEDRRHDLARRIARLDAQIDGLVYELYGLTEEEVGVVEGRGV